jgi:proline iminopeptidase
MNSQLTAANKADPLEAHLDELRERMPPASVIIGGAGDSRPAESLRDLGTRLDCEVVMIDGAGHQPWLEAPEEFAATLRGCVERQTRSGGSNGSNR